MSKSKFQIKNINVKIFPSPFPSPLRGEGGVRGKEGMLDGNDTIGFSDHHLRTCRDHSFESRH
jgi:hypothetical protein